MTGVKICGLTRPEDVDLACALGASYVGFVFASDSPRRVDLESARRLAASTRAGVARVGVFVDESYDSIEAAIQAGRLHLVQIHRPLRQEDLERVRAPIVSVARVRGGVAEVPSPEMLARCRSILFDTAGARAGGGRGTRFDWDLLLGREFPVPLILAGGLDADSVGRAIELVRPAAVDVASGVESEPGIKDHEKMGRFFEAVRQADGRLAGEAGGGRREADAKSR